MSLWSKGVDRSVTGEVRLGDVEANFDILNSIRTFINKTLNHRYHQDKNWCSYEVKNKNTVVWIICNYRLTVNANDDLWYHFTRLMSQVKVYSDRSDFMNTLYLVMKRNRDNDREQGHVQGEDGEDRLLDWE